MSFLRSNKKNKNDGHGEYIPLKSSVKSNFTYTSDHNLSVCIIFYII